MSKQLRNPNFCTDSEKIIVLLLFKFEPIVARIIIQSVTAIEVF